MIDFKKFKKGSIEILFVSVIYISGCVTTGTVLTDYDNDADFSQYKTYFWSDEFHAQNGDKTENEPLFYNTLIKKRLKKAIQNEMEGRGYRLSSEDPDILVNAQVLVQKRNGNESYAVYPSPYSYYYGTPYYKDNDPSKQGDLVIELIDKDQKQLVWQGYAKGVMEMETENRQEEIRKAVSQIFAEYNFRAGENVPNVKR